MVNEEISREPLNEGYHFVLQHAVEPTADALVEDLKIALAAPGNVIKNSIHPEHGEMSVKDLIRKDQGAKVIDIEDSELGDFRKLARKFGVDFSIVKIPEGDKEKYSVFFKARDEDAINAVMGAYAAKQMDVEKGEKPSILDKLTKSKEPEISQPAKVKEKVKEITR